MEVHYKIRNLKRLGETTFALTPPPIGQAKGYSVLGEAPGTYVLQR